MIAHQQGLIMPSGVSGGYNTKYEFFHAKLKKNLPGVDQRLECAAPKHWSKYTTGIIPFSRFHLLFLYLDLAN